MTQTDFAWGAGPSERYEYLAERFRPLFRIIGEGAVERELTRRLPVREIEALKQAQFGALRLPEAEGGLGATLPELFNLLIELSAADPNITQALRGHFGLVEGVLAGPHDSYRQRWAKRVSRGQTAGNARTEIGSAKQGAFSTTVTETDGKLVLNGEKYYTTGSLYADWINVAATTPDGRSVEVPVQRNAAGVAILDDWDGFGQTLTASGTAKFEAVSVDPADIIADGERLRYGPAFYQTVLLATLAGIGRSIADEAAAAVANRTRTYSHGTGNRSSDDPQVLQVVGRLRGNAYAAGAIVLQVARAIERAYQASGDEETEAKANAVAELEASQALTVLTNLVLESSTIIFDALGASAIKKPTALDRHWRNARALSSHNPRIYKDRIVGDFAVNGTLPPSLWRIGVAS